MNTQRPGLHTGHVDHGLRGHYLPAMPGCSDPGATIHHRTEVVAVALLRLAEIETDPNAQRIPSGRPFGRCERGLDCLATRHGSRRTRERDTEPVTPGREHEPAMAHEVLSKDLVVQCQRRSHQLRIRIPHLRRVLDIGEHEGDDTTRLFHSPNVSERQIRQPDTPIDGTHAAGYAG